MVSRAIKNTRIGGEVSEVLTEYGLPVLDAKIVQRIAYPNSAAIGKTVFETESKSSDAVAEMNALATEVKSYLE